MPVILQTTGLLILSNVFMTFAWYAHLKDMKHLPWFIAAIASWGIAFFEYMVQVPANRIGDKGGLDLPQLKILQEVITLTIFIPFTLYYMKRQLSWASCGRVSVCAGPCTSSFAANSTATPPEPKPPLDTRKKRRNHNPVIQHSSPRG